jgi:hypothetical protein
MKFWRRSTTTFRVLAVGVVLSPAVAFTQAGKPTAATYITKEEVDIVNKEGQGTDRTIRVADIGTENFAVGIIHRGATAATAAAAASRAGGAGGAGRGGAAGRSGAPVVTCGEQMATPPATGGVPGLIAHRFQTEGYYIVSGGGTLITGGHIVNGRESPSPDINGPTCGGGPTFGSDIVRKVVKAGDIIIIPAGVPHGWTDIGDHVDYLSFRPSPNILTAGYVHPTIKK